MADINRVVLLGRAGADAELKHTPSGTAVTTISLATSKKKGQSEEWVSTWHKVVIWGKRAESLAPRIKKGSVVFVQGELNTREWTDSSGNKRSITEVSAMIAEVIEKAQPTQNSNSSGSGWNDLPMTEDIPF